MLTALALIVAAQAVPEPQQVLTRDLDVTAQGVFVLAQAPNPEEEKNLSQDMEKAHERVQAVNADKIHEHVQGDNGKAACEKDQENQERPCACCMTHKVRTPAAPQPLVDGHGRHYYQIWGIVDWALAAEFWTAGAIFGVVAGAVGSCTNHPYTCDINNNNGNRSSWTKSDYQKATWGFGVTSAIALGVGSFFGWRGAHNIGIDHQMLQLQQPVLP